MIFTPEEGEQIVGIASISGTTIVATNKRLMAQDWIEPGVWIPYEGVDARHWLIRGGKMVPHAVGEKMMETP